MNRVVVIDYGMGNLHSVAKALEHVGGRVTVTDDARQIAAADRVVLPGVGAIGDCLAEIRRRDLEGVILEAAASRPFLGVCVGMQALLDVSEESGQTRCFGLFAGRVARFSDHLRDAQGGALKVPHMGWNRVIQRFEHPLWHGIEDASRFYFVHSFYAIPSAPEVIAGSSEHGIEFAAALARGNLFAAQFHPEKSQHAGLQLYRNFLHWDGQF